MAGFQDLLVGLIQHDRSGVCAVDEAAREVHDGSEIVAPAYQDRTGRQAGACLRNPVAAAPAQDCQRSFRGGRGRRADEHRLVADKLHQPSSSLGHLIPGKCLKAAQHAAELGPVEVRARARELDEIHKTDDEYRLGPVLGATAPPERLVEPAAEDIHD